MVGEVDQMLKEWALTVHPGIAISLTPPSAQRAGRGVGLYLMELLHSANFASNQKAVAKIELRYLVTAWGDDPEDAHQVLAKLAFTPLPGADFELELEAVPLSLWSAFGMPPGPSLVVRVPVRYERPEPAVPLVREMLTLDMMTSVPLYGLILGPGDVPLSDARLEIPALKLSTNADYKGRFSFAAVPPTGRLSLRACAKGRVLALDIDTAFPDRNQPLLVHFTPLEN